MKRARRLIATLVIVGSFGLGLAVLLSTSARAVENPCDPTYGLLQWCKS